MDFGTLGEAIRLEDAVAAAAVALPTVLLMAWLRRRSLRRRPVALRLD